jgi:hypothetical protein
MRAIKVIVFDWSETLHSEVVDIDARQTQDDFQPRREVLSGGAQTVALINEAMHQGVKFALATNNGVSDTYDRPRVDSINFLRTNGINLTDCGFKEESDCYFAEGAHELIGTGGNKVLFLRRIAEVTGAKPEEILFFDDSFANVDNAKIAGFKAIYVTQIDAVRTRILHAALTRLTHDPAFSFDDCQLPQATETTLGRLRITSHVSHPKSVYARMTYDQLEKYNDELRVVVDVVLNRACDGSSDGRAGLWGSLEPIDRQGILDYLDTTLPKEQCSALAIQKTFFLPEEIPLGAFNTQEANQNEKVKALRASLYQLGISWESMPLDKKKEHLKNHDLVFPSEFTLSEQLSNFHEATAAAIKATSRDEKKDTLRGLGNPDPSMDQAELERWLISFVTSAAKPKGDTVAQFEGTSSMTAFYRQLMDENRILLQEVFKNDYCIIFESCMFGRAKLSFQKIQPSLEPGAAPGQQ